MGRVYGEPAEVRLEPGGRPAWFTWRDRNYLVLEVQEHWLVNRDWWRETAPVLEKPELQFWRVEAAAVRGTSAGTYELRRDAAAGTWTLRRVAD
jgi:hypothetical protein